MSKIEGLIQQFCPDGVEFKELGKVCLSVTAGGDLPEKYKKGQVLPTNEYPYPIYSNGCDGNGLYGFTDKYKIGSDAVTISARGTIGYHTVREPKFTPIVRLITLIPNKEIVVTKFLNYVLDITPIGGTSGGIPQLTVPNVKKIKIPIPPIAFQQEIINILDKFTQLEADLEEELVMRRAQYEYYRNELLDFESKEVEWKTLVEVCDKTENIKWKENQNIHYQYIDLSSVSRENNKISETQTINSTNAPSRAQQIVNKDDVIFGTTRPTLKRYTLITSKYHNQICSTGFCVLRANQKVLLPKFLFFILTTASFSSYVENNQEGAGYPSISNSVVKKFKMPIPPLAEQERIVAILDKFDKLVNDISEGLPAEIEARRKQYEYYRGKLLDFKSIING
jgi:type I restriction enzyme S subunit